MNISTSSSPNRGEVLNTVNRYINTIDNFNSNITILLNNYNNINMTNENVNPQQPTMRRNEPVQTRVPRGTRPPPSTNVPNADARVPSTGNNRHGASASSRRANPRQSTEYINNPLNLDYNSGDDMIQNWTFRLDLRDDENSQPGTRGSGGPLYNYFYNYLSRQFNELGDLNLTDVVVAPSEREINNATRSLVFDASGSYVNTNCPISLEPFENGQEVCEIIHCGHLFNTTELQNWFQGNVRCPVCRYDIRTYITSPNEGTDENNASTNTNTPLNNNDINLTHDSTAYLITRINQANGRNRMSELFGNILQSFNSTTSRLNYVNTTDAEYPASLM